MNFLFQGPQNYVTINGKKIRNKPTLLNDNKQRRNLLTIINSFLIFSILILGCLK